MKMRDGVAWQNAMGSRIGCGYVCEGRSKFCSLTWYKLFEL